MWCINLTIVLCLFQTEYRWSRCAMYRLTITERQELVREERRRRSVARLVQVRQQASRAADRTRQRVQAESARQMAKVKQAVAAEYAADKENQLHHLEAEYSACLRQVGAAHLAAARQPDLTVTKRLVAAEQQQLAEQRQQAALRRVRDSQLQIHEEQRRTDTLRELNRALERVRADRAAQEGHQRRLLESRRRQEQQRRERAAAQSTAAASSAAVVFQSAFRPRVSFRDDAVQTRPRPRFRRTQGQQTTTDRGSLARDPTSCRGSQTRTLGHHKKTGTRFPEQEPAAGTGPASTAPTFSGHAGGSSSSRAPQTSHRGGSTTTGRSEAPTTGTSSASLTDIPHSESALTPSELQRQLSSASTGRAPPAAAGVPLRSETRPAPERYQVRREQSEYDARAAAREQELLQRTEASSERLRQQNREQAAAERGRQAQRRMSARSEYVRLLSELERAEAEERRERRQGGAAVAQQVARATSSLAQEQSGGVASYEERQRRLNQLFEDALLLAADAESEGDQSAEFVTPARDLAAEFDRHGRHVAELMAAAPPTAADGVAAGVQAVNATRSQLARASLSAVPPGTWTAAREEQSVDQSQYSSVSGAEPTSQWPTDESAAGAGLEQYGSGVDDSQARYQSPAQEQPPMEGYEGESVPAQQQGYGEGLEIHSQEGQMYGQEGEQMYGQEGEQMYGLEGEQMYGQEGEQMYGQEGEQMYGQEGEQMYGQEGMYGQEEQVGYGQEGQMYEEEGREMHGQEGEAMYSQQGRPLPGQEEQQYPEREDRTADETDQPGMYVGPDGIYPVGAGSGAGPDRTDATSPEVSSLRSGDVSSMRSSDVSSMRSSDLSSVRTSDVSTVRSSDLSALASSTATPPAGQTFDSTTTAYRTAPGDPGDPALATGLLQGAPAAVGSHGELRQYVSQLLDESRERLAQLSMPASSPSTVYGSASAGELSRSGAADVTFATAASPGVSSSDVADGTAGEAAPGVGPERSGTSGVYSEDPSHSAAAAAAAASDAYMQRYDEVMQKLSEVQQRRDELLRSYSSVAEELGGPPVELEAPRSSGMVRPRPPPSLSRDAMLGTAPHELSTILEQSRTPREASADPAGVTPSSGGGRPADVTSTGSLLSRTGVRSEPDVSTAAGAAVRSQDDTLSQFSNLASSQEYFSQESPRTGSAAAAAAGRLGAIGSTSEVSLRSSALERALEASREAIRSVSGIGTDSGAQPHSPSGQSSPDVGKIISKLGMKSRSGPLADPRADLSSSSSGSVSAQRPSSRTGRSSGDELRRRVLSRQAAQTSGSSPGTSTSSSSSSSASSVGSGSPGGSPSAGSSGMLAPLDLSAPAPVPAPDSSLDTDKFEAGVATGGVQSTPMKRAGPPPEAGPVAGLGSAVRMRPQDMTLPATSDED